MSFSCDSNRYFQHHTSLIGGTRPSGLVDCFKTQIRLFLDCFRCCMALSYKALESSVVVTGSLYKSKLLSSGEAIKVLLNAQHLRCMLLSAGHKHAGYSQSKFGPHAFCQTSQVLNEQNGIFADYEVISCVIVSNPNRLF